MLKKGRGGKWEVPAALSHRQTGRRGDRQTGRQRDRGAERQTQADTQTQDTDRERHRQTQTQTHVSKAMANKGCLTSKLFGAALAATQDAVCTLQSFLQPNA